MDIDIDQLLANYQANLVSCQNVLQDTKDLQRRAMVQQTCLQYENLVMIARITRALEILARVFNPQLDEMLEEIDQEEYEEIEA